jgi:ACS family glucarate transporter-like MFS transporter
MSLCVLRFGWRLSFLLFGVAGVFWAALWFTWFRDRPGSDTPDPRLPKPQPVDKRLLRSPSVYLILYQYFASQFTFFICFSWLLPYMKTRYLLGGAAAGMYASIPLYVGALANWISGIAVDKVYRMGHRSLSRKLPAMFGFGLASVALVAAASISSVNGFILFFSLATFGVDLTLSPGWTACADIGGEHTGLLSGAMNMMGSVGSLVSAVAFPLLFGMTGDIKSYFYVAVALNLAALASWWLALKEG